MSKILTALQWMLDTANNNSHGYDQTYRWGEKGDYDCSSAIITACEYAGIPLKTNGATYTGNMRSVALKTGFKDVTSSITLSTGAGLQNGDICLNTSHHVAMYCGNGQLVHASINEKGKATGGTPGDQTGKEFCVRSYYNYPWNHILRYAGDDSTVSSPSITAYNRTGNVNVSSMLNVRSSTSTATSANVIGTIKNGDAVVITGKTSDGWYRIQYNNGIGYVSSQYITVITDYTSVANIIKDLSNRNIITDTALWTSYCNSDTNIYWFGNKLCNYIANKTAGETASSVYEDIGEIIWDLHYRGIITDKELWTQKMTENKNVYYLLQKGLHYCRTY